jgi:hypothetical protein
MKRSPLLLSVVCCPPGISVDSVHSLVRGFSEQCSHLEKKEEVSIMAWFVSILARLALLFVWLFTPLVNRAFHGGWILPLLGIIFLPITTLVYVLVYYISGSVTGWGWLWVVLAVLLDLGAHSYNATSAARARSRRASSSQG